MKQENPGATELRAGPAEGTYFGRSLKAFRHEQHLTQLMFAERLGLDRPSLAKIERGSRMPPSSRAFWDRLRSTSGMTIERLKGLLAAYDADLIDRRRALVDVGEGTTIRRTAQGEDGSLIELVVHPGLLAQAGNPDAVADLAQTLLESSLRFLSSQSKNETPSSSTIDASAQSAPGASPAPAPDVPAPMTERPQPQSKQARNPGGRATRATASARSSQHAATVSSRTND